MTTSTIDRDRQRVRPRYARLALLGMALLTATVAVIGIPAFFQIADARGFVLTLLAISLVGTAAVWRFDAIWARLIALAACVALVMMMLWVVFGLFHPASPVEFVAGVTFVLGLVLAVAGNIAAIFQRRRGHLETHATAVELRVQQVVAGLVALAVVASVAMLLTTRGAVDEAAAAQAVEVRMTGFEFEPAVIEVAAGDQVLVRNSDAFAHDFAVFELGIDAELVLLGSQALFDVDAAPGSYTVFCTLHSNVDDPDPDHDMIATLVVR